MKVSDLQLYFRSLAQALRASGSAKAATDLEQVSTSLGTFDSMSVREFDEFLSRAETYERTGVVPAKQRRAAASRSVDGAKIKDAAQQVGELYERAIDDSVDFASIEGKVNQIGSGLSAAEAKQLAKEFGIERSVRTKKAALQEIHRKIADRKESHLRVQFRSDATRA